MKRISRILLLITPLALCGCAWAGDYPTDHSCLGGLTPAIDTTHHSCFYLPGLVINRYILESDGDMWVVDDTTIISRKPTHLIDIPVKIDTIRVDTVGWSVDSTQYESHREFTRVYYAWRYFTVPITKYVIDTTHYLTKEQLKLLRNEK